MHESYTHRRGTIYMPQKWQGIYTKVHLKSHEMIHTVEKPFACSKCDKTFKINGELKMHESYQHRRDTIYILQMWQGIYTKVHLKSHEMIHTGEKAFACSKCDKAYKSSQLQFLFYYFGPP